MNHMEVILQTKVIGETFTLLGVRHLHRENLKEVIAVPCVADLHEQGSTGRS